MVRYLLCGTWLERTRAAFVVVAVVVVVFAVAGYLYCCCCRCSCICLLELIVVSSFFVVAVILFILARPKLDSYCSSHVSVYARRSERDVCVCLRDCLICE